MSRILEKAELFAGLPPLWPEDLGPRIRAQVSARCDHKLVVLDDDPTGTQTVYDVPVLTSWDVDALRAEFAVPGPCFYILTNARSLGDDAARNLNREIARNVKAAAADERRFTIVSRSDSTLRGHFPLEIDALVEILGPFDATILIPYFEAGGRYTIGDVHYVEENSRLVPASDTPFARDVVFGFRHSNLREWVEEKTGGRVAAGDVASISLSTLREQGLNAVAEQLLALSQGTVCLVNAAAPRDLDVFVAGLLAAESEGRRFLFRTAAQFVGARLGLEPRPLLSPENLNVRGKGGGLIVVGSHVPKSTAQLEHLVHHADVSRIELDVYALLDSVTREEVLDEVLCKVNCELGLDRDMVIFTSRTLVAGLDAAQNLDIGRRISAALVEIVQRLNTSPRYLIAKGGVTSSDLATKALAVRRAMVFGQLLPGVPVWKLGAETKFPGVPFVVFPGNVGRDDALTEAVSRLA